MSAPAERVAPEHPSPPRGAARDALLWFGLLAAPLAWSIDELVSYGIASRACRMNATASREMLTHAGSVWLWIVLVATLLITLAGLWVSIGNWRETRGEKPGDGRSRFLALCGVLSSGGFLVAFVFMLSNLTVAPLCGK